MKAVGINANKDVRNVLLCRLAARRRFTNIDGRKSVVRNRVRSIEIALHRVLVRVIRAASFSTKSIYEVTTDLRLGPHAVPELRHIRYELGVLPNGRVGNFEPSVADA